MNKVKMETRIHDDAPAAPIGHNNPPSPVDETSAFVDDLYMEAKNWLDGEPIANQGQADGLAKLLTQARTTAKDAEAKRKAQTKPLDDQKKAIMAAWKPITDRLEMIEMTCKKALGAWLSKQEAEKRAKEEAARKIAEEAARKAKEAARIAEAKADDIEARAEAVRLREEAAHREAQVARASKDVARADGDGKRAVHLCSVWVATMIDPTAALRWCWQDPAGHDALLAAAQKVAEQVVRDGKREIPGFEITEHKEAV